MIRKLMPTYQLQFSNSKNNLYSQSHQFIHKWKRFKTFPSKLGSRYENLFPKIAQKAEVFREENVLNNDRNKKTLY